MSEDRTGANEEQSAAGGAASEFGGFLGTIPDPNARMVYAHARPNEKWSMDLRRRPANRWTLVPGANDNGTEFGSWVMDAGQVTIGVQAHCAILLRPSGLA
jgi:hypothetical protein